MIPTVWSLVWSDGDNHLTSKPIDFRCFLSHPSSTTTTTIIIFPTSIVYLLLFVLIWPSPDLLLPFLLFFNFFFSRYIRPLAALAAILVHPFPCQLPFSSLLFFLY